MSKQLKKVNGECQGNEDQQFAFVKNIRKLNKKILIRGIIVDFITVAQPK